MVPIDIRHSFFRVIARVISNPWTKWREILINNRMFLATLLE